MIKDMTQGKPSKILFYFAIPMVLGNMFQQLYNIMDSIIVGNFVGAEALAAVGASYPIVFICITVANGASIGCSVIISQYFGAKRMKDMKSSIYTALITAGVFGFVVMILGVIFTNNILSAMNTPMDIFKDAYDYLSIYFMGIVFVFIYNISTSAFNALGNSKTPLVFLIFSSILNVILDLVFVICFSMGVKGTAYATLIAQGISAILAITYLLLKLRSLNKIKCNKFDFVILKAMGKIAIPSILQQSIVSIGNLLVQVLVNGYGAVVIAGYTAATKIDSITILPMANMSNAVSNFTAQNLGAKKLERVREGYKSALKMIAIFCIGVVLILFLFGEDLISLFVDSNTNKEVISVGYSYLRIVSIFYFFMGLMVITNGVFRAAGDMKVFLISTLTNLSTRVLFAYGLANLVGESAIWWAVPCGWIFASTVSVLRYRSGKWKNKRVI